MKQRWLPVGLIALAIFVVNGASRLISHKFEINDDAAQATLGRIGVIVIGVLLFAVAIWWAIKYPFQRLIADVGLAILAGTVLAVVIGPFLGGSRPFAEGLEFFVYEVLLFLGIGAAAILLGFVVAVALGKDWRSRGLKRYEQHYARKPHRTARG